MLAEWGLTATAEEGTHISFKIMIYLETIFI